MNTRDRNTWIGLALVLLGATALLGEIGLLGGLEQLVPLALFGGGAVAAFALYRQQPERVWALPAGFVLAGLALASLDRAWSGGAFLAAIGIGFLALYLRDRRAWWPLIPAGVLMTLGVVATIDEASAGADGGTVFFLGLAATFAALYLLPDVSQRWAIYPALALAVVAVLTLSFGGGWLVPLGLILVGSWLLTRQAQPERAEAASPSGASEPSARDQAAHEQATVTTRRPDSLAFDPGASEPGASHPGAPAAPSADEDDAADPPRRPGPTNGS